ncbi:hypothetical protein CC80DRAFT_488901 [Byssothecium circinans]|uniref:Ribosomal protein S21 n=1 Tax=Byssothecium circinans TaxID=147558 RepID=A0A6A5U7E8_9PLEO|nr:hypothetical protein CC80DRAFT_488901 [Byssothecium circinans]
MSSRSLGEWLFRPSSLNRLSTSFSQPSRTAAPRLSSPTWPSRRALSNTTPSNSAQPQRKEEDEQTYPSQSKPAQPSRPDENPFSSILSSRPRFQNSPSQGQTTNDINSLMAGTNDPRYSRTRGSYAPARPANSSDEFEAARAARGVFGAGFSPPKNRNHRQPLKFDDMTMPHGLAANVGQPAAKEVEIPESEKNYPRLNASYGRMVELDQSKGRDLVRGISMLGSLMARNKVRADFMKQRYHERPGLKRKRLKSQRWRARFKKGFRDVTARVSELTRKGW